MACCGVNLIIPRSLSNTPLPERPRKGVKSQDGRPATPCRALCGQRACCRQKAARHCHGVAQRRWPLPVVRAWQPYGAAAFPHADRFARRQTGNGRSACLVEVGAAAVCCLERFGQRRPAGSPVLPAARSARWRQHRYLEFLSKRQSEGAAGAYPERSARPCLQTASHGMQKIVSVYQ